MTAHTEREGLRVHVRDLQRQVARLRAENMDARGKALEEAVTELEVNWGHLVTPECRDAIRALRDKS